jgi:hypothetical protein
MRKRAGEKDWGRVRVALAVMVAAVLGAKSASGQEAIAAKRGFTIVGVVSDSGGTPLSDAEVRLIVAGAQMTLTRTTAEGRFSISSDTSGPSKLRVRRLGFHPVEVGLLFPRDSSRVLSVLLSAAPLRLSEVEVLEEAEPGGWLREFHERRRTNSFGRYFTRETIQSSHGHHASEVLRTTPGVTLIGARRFGYVIRMRGCRYAPMVWIDGTRVPRAELDEVVRREDVAAMEVYPSLAGVPAQYMDRSNSGCGTIVVWTRHQ